MMCQAGFGSLDAAAGKYTCFYDTFAGGYGGRLGERRPRRRPVEQPEHRERADRGDRAQLPGPHRRALARRGLGGAGPLPRRPRAAQGLPLRPAHDLHRPRRPRPSRAVGRVRRRRGPLAEYVHVRDGEETRLGSKSTVELVPGDVISVRTCGGGGYGPPEEREPERVLRDVLEGKVSAERARRLPVAIADRGRRPRGGVGGDGSVNSAGRPRSVAGGREKASCSES